MASTDAKITTGGRGRPSCLPHSLRRTLLTLDHAERIKDASGLFSKAFEADPPLTYVLSSMGVRQRLEYIPTAFDAVLTAAAMNKASFDEVEDWKSCGIMLPPGYHHDNPLTLLPAGLVGVLWAIGIRGGKVGHVVDGTCSDNQCAAAALGDAISHRRLQGENAGQARGVLSRLPRGHSPRQSGQRPLHFVDQALSVNCSTRSTSDLDRGRNRPQSADLPPTRICDRG